MADNSSTPGNGGPTSPTGKPGPYPDPSQPVPAETN
jgi:hypothetical protein